MRQVRAQNLLLVFNFHFYRQYDGINTQKFPTFLSLLALFFLLQICSNQIKLFYLCYFFFSSSTACSHLRPIFNFNFYFILFKIDTSRYMYGGEVKNRKRMREKKINSICESFSSYYFYAFKCADWIHWKKFQRIDVSFRIFSHLLIHLIRSLSSDNFHSQCWLLI